MNCNKKQIGKMHSNLHFPDYCYDSCVFLTIANSFRKNTIIIRIYKIC